MTWDKFITVNNDGVCHRFGANAVALLDGEFLWFENGQMRVSDITERRWEDEGLMTSKRR
jgi:hypothetical protein